ncbi:hypothetical protein HYS47_02890 [Candidatus Woesearchaeota archaeon]|nr:hypothetical protein [Candidatus Woesearchaeota archaeon]
MKTTLGIVLVMLSMLVLAGCYNAGYYDGADDTAADDSEQAAPDSGNSEDQGAERGEFEDDLFGEDNGDSEESEDVSDIFDGTEADASDSEAGSSESDDEPGSVQASGTSSGTIETGSRFQDATLTVTEGDLVSLAVEGTDPDGDPITYTFGKPLDEKGRWQTKQGNAGTYSVVVSASDGQTTVEKTLKIVVLEQNKAPVINVLRDVVANEGETLDLREYVEYSDPEGDDVTVTYSGWMTGPTRTTTYDDAGQYEVVVTASDGAKKETTKLKVVVQDVNRAPDFDIVVG